MIKRIGGIGKIWCGAKVTNIDDARPHKVSEVICVKCGHRWLADRPETTRLKELECPECHRQGYAIETGETNNVGGVDWEQWCD